MKSNKKSWVFRLSLLLFAYWGHEKTQRFYQRKAIIVGVWAFCVTEWMKLSFSISLFLVTENTRRPNHSIYVKLLISVEIGLSVNPHKRSCFLIPSFIGDSGQEEINISVDGEWLNHPNIRGERLLGKTKNLPRTLCLLFDFTGFHGLRNWTTE